MLSATRPLVTFALLLAACSDGASGEAGGMLAAGGPSIGTRPDEAATSATRGSGSTPHDGGLPSAPNPTDGGVTPSLDAAAAPIDPCPTLPVPSTCFNRNVVYREWGPSAVGDGTYFASQAPTRLGFNRVQGNVWIVKFRTEANSYAGRVTASGDSSGGIAWISDSPCGPAFAVANRLVTFEVHGGGSLNFLVVKDAADAQKIATDPALASWRSSPKLKGDTCYYAGFQNSTHPTFPIGESAWDLTDDCGASTGGASCYYLAMDFAHYLHPFSGGIMAGNVIAGLTH
ncbi:MAG: hypothetical protein IPG50_04945 [Myxococcales bacterium]|nr:hypothetical protein [Myxococcales bacterium]